MELKEAIDKLKEMQESVRYKTIIENEERDEWKKEVQAIDTVLEELNNRIPRKDIEDLKEKIHWELDKNGITRGYQIIIDGYFNKLLNKE